MCGICGIVTGHISNSEAEIFKKLLVMSAFRGMDSTGVFAIQGTGKKITTQYTKGATNPMNFLDATHATFDTTLNTSDAKALIGHTRHATKGSVTKKNAHPFNFSNIIGCHNGTLWTDPKMDKDYETDSEKLFAFMNEHGLEETLNEYSHASDAYTLVWYDKKQQTLNAIRNDKRPLSFAPVSGGSTIYWASEDTFLRFILDRENIKENGMYTIHPGHLLTFDMTSNNPALNYDVTKIKIKPKPIRQVWTGSVRHNAWEGNTVPNFLQGGGATSGGIGKPETTILGTTPGSDIDTWDSQLREQDENDERQIALRYDGETNRLVPRDPPVSSVPVVQRASNVVNIDSQKLDKKGIQANFTEGGFYWIGQKGFTEKEYQAKLEVGCAWCTVQCEKGDKEMEWMNTHEYLCGDCKDRPEVQEYKPFYATSTAR